MANEYWQGETVKLKGTITDSAAAAANPSASTVARLKPPSGDRVIADTAMTNAATGSYYITYPTTSDSPLGEWHYEVITKDGDDSDVSIGAGAFILKAREA